ncbi:hypothetical protein OTSTA716_1299 [Orientia tsutsugamushi str. TA716]|uniref:Uncharacterized protein n=1 Tax=Orientia tsutsugamushi str. TA716 TaxID=1359175 RepID=A0A0F3P383_ORITS|nr:hypothetical protein OTSTA716_1299 [Orientia tsutsugamushi str. TA716]
MHPLEVHGRLQFKQIRLLQQYYMIIEDTKLTKEKIAMNLMITLPSKF